MQGNLSLSLRLSITDAVPNDLTGLAARLPQLRAIAHNGGESARAMRITGALGLLVGRLPEGLDVTEWMVGHWLLGWGEAISTGMLVAVFVAFKPQWLLTYSDLRYLPGQRQGGDNPTP